MFNKFCLYHRLNLESKKEELNSKLESLANQPFGDSPLFRTAFLASLDSTDIVNFH